MFVLRAVVVFCVRENAVTGNFAGTRAPLTCWALQCGAQSKERAREHNRNYSTPLDYMGGMGIISWLFKAQFRGRLGFARWNDRLLWAVACILAALCRWHTEINFILDPITVQRGINICPQQENKAIFSNVNNIIVEITKIFFHGKAFIWLFLHVKNEDKLSLDAFITWMSFNWCPLTAAWDMERKNFLNQ